MPDADRTSNPTSSTWTTIGHRELISVGTSERGPFADGSISGVYNEHCLEHLTYGDCLNALLEFKRVLTPGGTLRVVVPDAELYFDLYQKHKAGEQVSFPYTHASARRLYAPDGY